MELTTIIVIAAIIAFVAFVIGYYLGHASGYQSASMFEAVHKKDPVIPPGGKLPYGIAHGRTN